MPFFVVNPLRNGFLGVSVFFMLSGFVIAYQYLWRVENTADLRQFALARFARLYPVYALALLAQLPFAWESLRPADALLVPLMLQAWTLPASDQGYGWLTQAWTLSVELFFYLMAPFLLRGLRRLPGWQLLGAAAALALLLVLTCAPSFSPGIRDHPFGLLRYVPIPVVRAIEFAYGAVLCLVFQRFPGACRRSAHPLWLGGSIAGVAGIMLVTRDAMLVAAAMALCGVLLVQLASSDGLLARLLSSKVMLLLGGASYALYILQAPVREALALLPVGEFDRLLNLPVAVLVSILVFRFWEEPARRLIRRSARRPATT